MKNKFIENNSHKKKLREIFTSIIMPKSKKFDVIMEKDKTTDVGGGNTGQIDMNSPHQPAIAPELYQDPPGGEAG